MIFPVQIPPDFQPSDSDGDGVDLRWDGKPCPCQEPPYRPAWGGGFRAARGKHIHGAIDIMAAEGALVVAPSDGTIPLEVRGVTMDGKPGPHPGAGTKDKAGHYFFLVTEDGSLRWYGSHLRDKPLVEPGAKVQAGDLLGYVGRTGNASVKRASGIRGCPHLHLALRALTRDRVAAARAEGVDVQGTALDPVPFLRRAFADWRHPGLCK